MPPCALRDVTLARDVADLFTTVLVRAVRDAVARADPLVERGDVAMAREDVFARDVPEFVAADTARDADVERLMVLRCATFFAGATCCASSVTVSQSYRY